MIYITGDTHGDFNRIQYFCTINHTTKDDILIILGDTGLNYYGEKKDVKRKKEVSKLPITIFSIHGNHENRPENIESYKLKDFHSGKVYYEEEFPDILFAKDGEIYDFNGLQTIVIGGAYSIDKYYRIINGWNWWEDEQPSEETKAIVENNLENSNWKIDVVLTHTCPLSLEPREWFLKFVDQSTVDKKTETWLEEIKEKLDYKYWFCGHFHGEKKTDEIEFLFESTKEFPNK